MIQARPYQVEAIDAMFAYWAAGGENPLVEMATGLGKSVVVGEVSRRVLGGYPDMRILMLVHVRELVEQNFRALLNIWPQAPVGIFSAGLGRRDAHHRITMASIQSVYRKARLLGPRDLVLVDEAHLVPSSGAGMYRTLLEDLRVMRPDLRVGGFTATPFRLDSGRLDEGADRLFTETVYSYDIGAGIRDGWLSPLISKASLTEIDVGNVTRRGGEFVAGAMEQAADNEGITRAAAAEIVQLGADRHSWLAFCSGVKHAYHVRDALRSIGINAETVTGETPAGDRARIVRDFRSGLIRCLTNAQVLTTGFDAPGVDLVAFLRPTLSTGLYLQMIGRGVRKADGKSDCLVLDFAGNVRRHGPVDAVSPPPGKRHGSRDEETRTTVEAVRAKECPTCRSLIGVMVASCPYCGHEFPITPKHEAKADTTPIMSGEVKRGPELMPLISWEAVRHEKYGSPDSMRVVYRAGLMTYSEWVCFEHTGVPRLKAEKWWRQHGGGEVPASVTEALERFASLQSPTHIGVVQDGKFFRVVSRQFAKSEAAA